MIICKQQIQTSPIKIWQALTEKNQQKEWYFDIPDFELQIGSNFHFYESGESKEYLHRCEILEIIPEKRLSHTWTHPSHSKGSSVLTWDLIPNETGTLVELKHDGVETFADAGPAFSIANFEMGWKNILTMLKLYLNGIKRQTYSIEINASSEKVWEQLFSDKGYQSWTSIFTTGSHYKGEIKAGNRIHLLDANGGGMFSDIIFLIPNKLLIFQHLGELVNFEEQTLDSATEKWSGSCEIYRLKEESGITKLNIEVDLAPEYFDFINSKFPLALEKLKENCLV